MNFICFYKLIIKRISIQNNKCIVCNIKHWTRSELEIYLCYFDGHHNDIALAHRISGKSLLVLAKTL